mgnify:CR=1 FL=1|tara:strand:- start:568 stop:1710 length:1143 start_codon:yes stop_codon:yes gene_type:complete
MGIMGIRFDMSVESLVQERYAEGAQERQESLCCPVDYDTALLKILPQEIIDKDYGCGDPSRYARDGDTVLDLGSGGGKICYMAAQIVGDQGAVIGVDMTDDMLALASSYQSEMAAKLGGDRVSFRKGYIQDLSLDVRAMEIWLERNPVTDAASLQALNQWQSEQRSQIPMIANSSVDLVISNCVLNLVAEQDRRQMLEGIFRVLKPGGRVAISDIVCDEKVPQHLKEDATLWSGCISGAFHELDFAKAFLDVGFVAVEYDKWDEQPWQVLEGIEFRSVTLCAVKPENKNLVDAGQAVIYRGPFSETRDDLGNLYRRGERIAVSHRTFALLSQKPYADNFIFVQPEKIVDVGCFSLPTGTLRPVAETKGGLHGGSSSSDCC